MIYHIKRIDMTGSYIVYRFREPTIRTKEVTSEMEEFMKTAECVKGSCYVDYRIKEGKQG